MPGCICARKPNSVHGGGRCQQAYLDHPVDHPDDRSGSVGSRLDRRGIPTWAGQIRLEPTRPTPSIRLL